MKLKITPRGFTLLELLLALAISGIVLTIGIPSFKEMISNSRRNSTMNALVADLNLARNEAIKRVEAIKVCIRQADTDHCDTSDTASWNNGWLVVYGDKDSVLRKHDALKQISLTFPRKHIAFSTRGTVFSTGTITICDDRGVVSAISRVLGGSGRLRIGTEAEAKAEAKTCLVSLKV